MCREGAWAELTAEVTFMKIFTTQSAQISIIILIIFRYCLYHKITKKIKNRQQFFSKDVTIVYKGLCNYGKQEEKPALSRL